MPACVVSRHPTLVIAVATRNGTLEEDDAHVCLKHAYFFFFARAACLDSSGVIRRWPSTSLRP
jgi:hypothetical protein